MSNILEIKIFVNQDGLTKTSRSEKIDLHCNIDAVLITDLYDRFSSVAKLMPDTKILECRLETKYGLFEIHSGDVKLGWISDKLILRAYSRDLELNSDDKISIIYIIQ